MSLFDEDYFAFYLRAEAATKAEAWLFRTRTPTELHGSESGTEPAWRGLCRLRGSLGDLQ